MRAMFLSLFTFAALVAAAADSGTSLAKPLAAETVTLDGRGPGRTFEGLGGLSAGAGSRLLIDYPEPQRSQLLDFLFKPNFGASLHHLKVEIGGDVNSSEGSEPSYARTRDEFEHPRPEYFQRGYEWWLMREARKRNPGIYLDVLQWGAPDWIGDKDVPDAGDPNALTWKERIPRNRKKFFSQDNADFIAGFIQGAKKYHGLDINYCGTWNETPIKDTSVEVSRLEVPWIKLLRKTLDGRGLPEVKIIARDCGWGIVDLMERDAELKNAIYAAGAHYKRRSTPAAIRCGKPLWGSEQSAGWGGNLKCTDNHPGYGGSLGWAEARALAKMYNLNYINGRMTKSIFCYLINSYYDALSWPKCSVIGANAPWSGHYEIWLPVWAIAHTTQFAQPGWRYLDGACGVLKGGGSYVCLRSPKPGSDYSAVIETGDAKQPQTLAFRVTGGLSAATVHVWRSSAQSQFERQEDIRLAGDSFTVKLEPGCLYSLTTTTGQQKRKTVAPPLTQFPIPYRDNFDGYAPGGMAKYFADQGGTFEVAKRPEGGNCLRQTVTRRGVDWDHYPTPEPYTMIGSPSWRNYEVSCDALIEGTGYAAIFGRIKCSLVSVSEPPYGYWLKVGSDGRWELKAFRQVLASGSVSLGSNQWHKLALTFCGSRIAASIDSVEVKAIEDDSDLTAFGEGMAGLGSGWNNAQFGSFSVREIPEPAGAPRPVNLAKGKKATASSNYGNDYSARMANDGNPATRWNARQGDAAGAWLEIDFGEPTRFNRVAARQFDKRIEKYKLQHWDADQWRDAFSGQTSDECWSATFAPVKASKVRLLVLSTRSNIEPSIFEFAVYDDNR
jgi:Glycosyl hydrolase family 59/Galactocerebrosidase, C-terminal lectin domain/F5/8 type C domain